MIISSAHTNVPGASTHRHRQYLLRVLSPALTLSSFACANIFLAALISQFYVLGARLLVPQSPPPGQHLPFSSNSYSQPEWFPEPSIDVHVQHSGGFQPSRPEHPCDRRLLLSHLQDGPHSHILLKIYPFAVSDHGALWLSEGEGVGGAKPQKVQSTSLISTLAQAFFGRLALDIKILHIYY